MNRNKIFLILFLVCLKLSAQNFNKIGANDTINRLYWGVKGVNGHIVTYAASAEYFNTPYPYSMFSFNILDYSGNLIYDTIVGDTSFTITSNIGHTFKNGYFGIPGLVYNINQYKADKMSAFLISEDLRKDYKLFIPVDSGASGSSNCIYRESANEIVVTAHSQPLNNLGTSSLRFFVLDTLNNIRVNKTITYNGKWLVCNSVFKFEQNYFAICNRILNNNTNDPQDLVIYKLDTLGNVVSTYQTTNGKWYGAVSSAVLPNGDFIIGGFYAKGFYSNNPLDGVWQQKYLARFDKNLNLIWRKTFGTNDGISEITKVMIASDSTIVGCGVDTKTEIVGADTMGHGTGCIFKFSLNGDSIWMHKYQGIDGDYGEINWMTNVDELPNNEGFVGCGYIDNYFPQYSRGWVFKTDANGCLDASCTDYMKEIDEVNSIFELVLFPNPANTQVSLNYFLGEASQGIVTLTSATGKLVYEEEINRNTGSLHLNTSNLSNGMYLLKVQSNKGAAAMKKLMIMH
jgi:hypothetical protein